MSISDIPLILSGSLGILYLLCHAAEGILALGEKLGWVKRVG